MFNLLGTFMAVYETRSFSLAAEHLFTSQPTVSHHIQQLEHELNVTRKEHNTRCDSVPAAAGDKLNDVSGNTLADLDKTEHTLQD
ncbi:LysR family transcriptional regulator, partial [Enterobacter quasiroggenkampii]|nr:LysR family transcriptional regulator [Enterobacter quasiroggenkampii]